MGSAQKGNETKHTAGVASVQDAEKLTVSSQIRENTEATPSFTYTTKEIEEEEEAEDSGS